MVHGGHELKVYDFSDVSFYSDIDDNKSQSGYLFYSK
jgi:hypothetical protein